MKSLIILFFGFLLLTACGPSSNFSSDDARFKSLMDGETVEVVTDDELVDSLEGRDPSDGDINNESDSGAGDDSEDEGVYSCEGCEESIDDDGGFMDIVRGNGNRGENGNRGGRSGGMTCRDRLIDQVNRGRRSEMMTSPGEIEIDRELYEAIKCVKGNGKAKEGHSKNGGKGMRKIYVCHIPSGDYEKRQTKCLPIPAVVAHIREHNRHGEHIDYAGPCKDREDESREDGGDSEEEGGDDE